MDHRAAVESNATERYILGEMEEPARAAFEEHFFSCAECASEVRWTARFEANARAVMRARVRSIAEDGAGSGPARVWPGRHAWVPAAVAACLAMVFLYPAAFVASRPASVGMEELPAAVPVPAGVRGGESKGRSVEVHAGDRFLRLRLDVGDSIQAPRLRWSVRTASGRELVKEVPRRPEVELLLPAAEFPAGTVGYELRLTAADAPPDSPLLDRYPFQVHTRP